MTDRIQPPIYDARVKFFSPQKGYGFVALDNGQDAFLHYTVLEGLGVTTLYPEQKLRCTVQQGEKSLVVTKILALSEPPEGAHRFRPAAPPARPAPLRPAHEPVPPPYAAPYSYAYATPPARDSAYRMEAPTIPLTSAGRFATGTVSHIREDKNYGFCEVPNEGRVFIPPPVLATLPPEARAVGTPLEVVVLVATRGPLVIAARPLPSGTPTTPTTPSPT